MPSLPLKVKVGIRDHWDKDGSGVKKALGWVKEILGYECVVEPEWQLLLAELDKAFPDKAQLVAIVAGYVESWCNGLVEVMGDGGKQEWIDVLLEKTADNGSRVNLFLEVSETDSASTVWSDARGGFLLALPRDASVQPNQLQPVFYDGLLASFNAKPGTSLPRHAAPAAADDWADVVVAETGGRPEVTEKPSPRSTRAADLLPKVETMPRPDELFLKPPYHLVMHAMGRVQINVHCSHSPTLQFLADYLKRWCRVNHDDSRKPPAVDVKLQQSPFGLGLMYDGLTISTDGRHDARFGVTPTIMLALIEGLLGYERVSVDGTTWTYRRDRPLAV